jgi:hypothetical protein
MENLQAIRYGDAMRCVIPLVLVAVVMGGCGSSANPAPSNTPRYTGAQSAVSVKDVERDIQGGSSWDAVSCDRAPDFHGNPAFQCVAANSRTTQKIAAVVLKDGTISESAF